MCKCTPNIRTPYCGRNGCDWPNSKPVGTRLSKEREVVIRKQQEGMGRHVEIEELLGEIDELRAERTIELITQERRFGTRIEILEREKNQLLNVIEMITRKKD